MSYKITIVINAEDTQDVKTHLSIIREQTLAAIKLSAEHPTSPMHYSGINSGHSITIEKE